MNTKHRMDWVDVTALLTVAAIVAVAASGCAMALGSAASATASGTAPVMAQNSGQSGQASGLAKTYQPSNLVTNADAVTQLPRGGPIPGGPDTPVVPTP